MFCLQLCSIIIIIIIVVVHHRRHHFITTTTTTTTITVTATPNASTTLNIISFVNISHVRDLHESTDFVTLLLLNGMFKDQCVFCYDLFPAFDPLSMAYVMTCNNCHGSCIDIDVQ
jgi:hypothetical protein